jgi:hypothetical protein
MHRGTLSLFLRFMAKFYDCMDEAQILAIFDKLAIQVVG